MCLVFTFSVQIEKSCFQLSCILDKTNLKENDKKIARCCMNSKISTILALRNQISLTAHRNPPSSNLTVTFRDFLFRQLPRRRLALIFPITTCNYDTFHSFMSVILT